MTATEKKELQTQIAETVKDLELCSQAYNSKNLKVTIFLSGTTGDGKTFAGTFTLNRDNEYIVEFFNQYGAACAAARMKGEQLLKGDERIK